MIYFFPIYVDEFELYFIPKIVRLASPIGYNTLKGPTSQGLHKIPKSYWTAIWTENFKLIMLH